MPMQALVTGAFGFVGRHMARHLAEQGYAVVGIGHGTWNKENWRAWGITEWHTADVSSTSLHGLRSKPDIIFHCAGSGSVSFSVAEPAADFERTVGTTLSVLEFMRLKSPDATLIIPSSAAVYGEADKLPIETGAVLQPLSPYGVNKKIAEDLCRSYAAQFGIRMAAVRFFSIYGVGLRKQLFWDACNKLSKGVTEFAGTGEETRDWISIEDAVRLLEKSIQFASSSVPVVNGGSGKSTRITEIVTAIAIEIGVDERPRFTGNVRAGDPTKYCAEIQSALAWGWSPQSDLFEEIRAYVDWYKRGAP